jgi:dihydrodipicolinate synthase/N-acetylneuraminate lyase
MEVPDAQIIPFYQEVASAAPGLALSVYETPRAKKTLTVDLHRGIRDAIPDYLMVKANSGTVGATLEGCRDLAKIVNVFVTERRFAELGRAGATGGCSSMVYWFPSFVLDLWRQVEATDWVEADRRCAVLADLVAYLQTRFAGRGFMDSALDRMGSQIRPILTANLRCRGPYPHASASDVAILRRWCAEHDPALLQP